MRVARVITRLNRGGPARTLLAIEPLLRSRGVESLLFAGTPDEGEEDLSGDFATAGIEVRRIPALRRSIRPWADASARHELERQLRAFDPEVLHSHTFKAGWLARTVEAGPRVRRVHTFHGHLFSGAFLPPVGSLLARLERRLARRTDLLIAVSESVRREVCDVWRVAPRDRTAVLPGVLLPEFTAPVSERERRDARARLLPAVGPWLGTLARLTAVKAPHFWLDVAQAVVARRPDARFVWVGDGDGRARFLAAIARRGLSENVLFVGWQRDMRAWHLALDIELLLSDQEGLPLSLLEATALRVPVVATRVGGVPDLIRDGIDGRLVEPRDRRGAADAIVELLAAPMADHDRPPLRGLPPADHAHALLRHYEVLLSRPSVAA